MKILSLISGRLREVLPISSSTGSDDADKVVQTGSNGKLDSSLIPAGIGAGETISRTASEAISAGNAVNLFDDVGTPSIRNADASDPAKAADGYVEAAVASGQQGTVHDYGYLSGLSGLTVGARYYLSATTPGEITDTPVTTSGAIHQYIGKAVAADTIAWAADDPITLV